MGHELSMNMDAEIPAATVPAVPRIDMSPLERNDPHPYSQRRHYDRILTGESSTTTTTPSSGSARNNQSHAFNTASRAARANTESGDWANIIGAYTGSMPPRDNLVDKELEFVVHNNAYTTSARPQCDTVDPLRPTSETKMAAGARRPIDPFWAVAKRDAIFGLRGTDEETPSNPARTVALMEAVKRAQVVSSSPCAADTKASTPPGMLFDRKPRGRTGEAQRGDVQSSPSLWGSNNVRIIASQASKPSQGYGGPTARRMRAPRS